MSKLIPDFRADGALAGLIPQRYLLPVVAPYYEYLLFVNWLEVQITANPEEEIPALREVSGWRNREVYDWVKHDKVWVDRLAVEMYGPVNK